MKKGILLGFFLGKNAYCDFQSEHSGNHFFFKDKDTLPLKDTYALDVRVVPGGSSIRAGSYISDGVIMMPPSFVNIGVYVDEGTLIDSHVNLGSCAQVGKNCHLSGGVQIGGVLEPIGASPVIIGDNVFIGLQSGVMEGTRVGDYAVIGAGVIIGKSTPVIDLENKLAYTSEGIHKLKEFSMEYLGSGTGINVYGVSELINEKENNYGPEIPKGAVVVPGFRVSAQKFLISAPTIVKYRDSKTNASTALESCLR